MLPRQPSNVPMMEPTLDFCHEDGGAFGNRSPQVFGGVRDAGRGLGLSPEFEDCLDIV